jgi:rhodanese-related sulfurtransferase
VEYETSSSMVAAAQRRVANLAPADVAAALDEDVVLVDVRELDERTARGFIAGAVFAPRGMLEFLADGASPHHRPEFEPARRTIVYSASGARSALAADTLSRMGYRNVASLDGGITAWEQSGLPLERDETRSSAD